METNIPRISLICAISKNRVIGKKNRIPWHIPEDFKHFKEITWGHAIIMGQRTYESIGHPLPGRTNVILSDESGFDPGGLKVARNLEEAFAIAREDEKEEIFICGGGSVYAQAIGKADKLYLTIINKEIDGDAYFPEYDGFGKIISRSAGKHGELEYEFLEFERE